MDLRKRQRQRLEDFAETIVPLAIDYLRSKEWENYDWSNAADRHKARHFHTFINGAKDAMRSIETHDMTNSVVARALGEAATRRLLPASNDEQGRD